MAWEKVMRFQAQFSPQNATDMGKKIRNLQIAAFDVKVSPCIGKSSNCLSTTS
jgi:hypothetical protein